MRVLGHRRRGLHRLESGRRPARARRRGDGRRRPLDRAPREPRRGARRRAPSWSSWTSATAPRWPSWPREAAPEAIFHLAAQIDVRKSVADPAFDASINVGGTANVLEAARAAGAGASSSSPPAARSTARATARSCRSPRTPPIAPLSAYGQSKYAAEGYLALYERLYGLSGVSLRLGNVYGPRQDPLGEAGVIATGSRRFVFVSTGGAIYGEGEGQELPLPESAPIAPLAPYGQSKFAAEGYLALYERLYGLSGVSLPARQRLRAAPGPARRGGRDRDLLRQLRPARRPDRLRRRHARPATTYMWATWSRRRWPRRVRGDRRDQRRHRHRDRRARAGRAARASSAARGLRAGVRPAPRRARCSGSRSTPPAPSAELGWKAETASTRACARSTPRAPLTNLSVHARPGLCRQGVRLPVPQGDLRPVLRAGHARDALLHRLPEAEGAALRWCRRRRHRPREGRGAARLRRRRDPDRAGRPSGAGGAGGGGLDRVGEARLRRRRPTSRASSW